MPSDRSEVALERISRILLSHLCPDGYQRTLTKQKIKRLKQCGFDNTEIAKMLGTTRNTVGVAVHSLKSSRKKKHPKKAKLMRSR